MENTNNKLITTPPTCGNYVLVAGFKINVMSTKAYRTFDGKKFTLYSSGSKKKVYDYFKKYGVPKNAKYRKIKVGNEYRLYMMFSK